jgi:hypothetical protein
MARRGADGSNLDRRMRPVLSDHRSRRQVAAGHTAALKNALGQGSEPIQCPDPWRILFNCLLTDHQPPARAGRKLALLLVAYAIRVPLGCHDIAYICGRFRTGMAYYALPSALVQQVCSPLRLLKRRLDPSVYMPRTALLGLLCSLARKSGELGLPSDIQARLEGRDSVEGQCLCIVCQPYLTRSANPQWLVLFPLPCPPALAVAFAL